jgi:hypothetical protein
VLLSGHITSSSQQGGGVQVQGRHPVFTSGIRITALVQNVNGGDYGESDELRFQMHATAPSTCGS